MSAYAPLFQNPGTLSQYVGHIHKAEMLLQVRRAVDPAFQSHLLWGIKAVTIHRPRTRYKAAAVKQMMHLAAKEGDAESAWLYAIAYSWLFKSPG